MRRGNKKGNNEKKREGYKEKKENKNMFEVEKKFNLNESELEKLLEGAQFLGEKTFRDAYYDTPDFTLSKNNIWLRKRGTEFQLKLPVFQKEKMQTDQFQEIEGEEKIREIFAIPPIVDFETDIKNFGYGIFCDLTTVRKKYEKENFVIDLDQTVSNFPGEQDFSYQVVEIELMVAGSAEIPSADKKIIAFAKKNQLKVEKQKGKVAQYLFQKKPKHFKALVEAGIVKAERIKKIVKLSKSKGE